MDAQAAIGLLGVTVGVGTRLAASYHAALEASVTAHFPSPPAAASSAAAAAAGHHGHSHPAASALFAAAAASSTPASTAALAAAATAAAAAAASSALPHAPMCINCMCHASDNLYHMSSTSLLRASDDFYPREAATWAPHIAHCAYNALFLGEVGVPDWDQVR